MSDPLLLSIFDGSSWIPGGCLWTLCGCWWSPGGETHVSCGMHAACDAGVGGTQFSCGTHAACDTGRGPGRRYIAFIERTVMYWPPPVPTLILHFVTTSLATVQSAFSPHTADTMSIDVFDRCSISIYCAQFVDRCLTECRWMCSIDVRR